MSVESIDRVVPPEITPEEVVEGYSLERANADMIQLHQVTGEFVHELHYDETSFSPMTPQESINAIANHLDWLVHRVTEAHNIYKLADEDKDTYQGDNPYHALDLRNILQLADQHLTVEQAAMADFIHRFRTIIVQD
jgi:hypothetical protein